MTTNPTDREGSGAARKPAAAGRAVAALAPEAYMNQPTVPAPELTRLLAATHPDPHAVLGPHPSPRGMVVRVLKPEAERVLLLVEGDAPRSMVKTDEVGFFEALVEDRTEAFPYQLEVHDPEGKVYTLRDAYAFPPTLGELDLHLFGEGRHEYVYQKLGAHKREVDGVSGVAFAVWAPNAQRVSIVGDFNNWDGRLHQMRRLESSGVWELFIPDTAPGMVYKFEIRSREGAIFLKADPYAFYSEVPPDTASIVYEWEFQFQDQDWLDERAKSDFLHRPLSIYEVHLGSWRWAVEGEGRPLGYRETAPLLADYVLDMGFTHVEFMPLKGHPYTPSWGYQVTSYYAPTARYGSPDDFRFLVDYLHQRGIGVILDWVPAHFPKDAWALGRFDGSALYEHLDSRLGEHPDWGTYIFNFGRNEVRNFLLANALFWIEEYHIDGLRLDAVASMLYLDYSRSEGEWIPNKYGGRENIEAISLLRELNEVVHGRYPGVLMIAEESTSWGGVSRPTYTGGLGFGYKWNMGWMHDTLEYFSKDSIHRRFHHNKLTFGLLYAWSENFVLPLSHDEVVYGKRSLLNKMPGDRWQKFANLRALYGYMWAHPGKKLLFMGGEFGQWNEWQYDQSLDWHLLAAADHRGLQNLMRDLNRLYRGEPALWEADSEPTGFQWIDANNGDESVLAFMRTAPSTGRRIVCVCNLTPVVRYGYRVGLPRVGSYREIMNTDASVYGGSNVGNAGSVAAESVSWHGQPCSVSLVLPPLATLWFEVPFDEEGG